jgi:hypothetical protein
MVMSFGLGDRALVVATHECPAEHAADRRQGGWEQERVRERERNRLVDRLGDRRRPRRCLLRESRLRGLGSGRETLELAGVALAQRRWVDRP